MSGESSERGSIAILALWGIVLIGLLIAAVAFATRGELQIARNVLAASRARLAAEAGTQLGLLRLLQRREAGAVYFDGSPEDWRQGRTRVAIAIADEAGKVDLNVGSFELLAGLFEAAGTPHEAAQLIACNVLDWRGDQGSGCPQPDRPHAGRRFVVAEELAEVPGVDERLYDRVAGDVTTATGATAVDPMVAQRAVLLAIPGATESLVDGFMESRATLRDFGASDANLLAAATPFVMMTPDRDFTITASAMTSDGARYRAELQVRLTGRAAQPYQVVAWRAPPADRGLSPAAKRPRAP